MLYSLNLLLKRCGEELQEQVFLARIGTVVEQLEHDGLDELGRVGRWQSKPEFGQITRVCLQHVEEILVELHFVVVLFAQLFDVIGLIGLDVLFVLFESFVLHQDVLVERFMDQQNALKAQDSMAWDSYLKCDSVFDQQTNLDVHHVQVLFQVLVHFDSRNDLSLQLLQLWE